MRKLLIIILAFVVLAIGFGIARNFSNSQKSARPARPVIVPTAFVKPVKNADLPVFVPASGRLMAKNRIELFSEVQGILEYNGKEFKSGVKYSQGEPLVKLNSEEFYSNLMAQRSNFQNLVLGAIPDIRLDFPDSYPHWQQYLESFEVTNKLAPLPEPKTQKERLFISSKGIYTSFYTIQNLEVRLSKYTLRAPFNGVLTEAYVTPGTLVSPGQRIGEFIDTSVYELEVAISSSMASKLAVGDEVQVEELEDSELSWTGNIIRINGKVDEGTQTVKVFIELRGKNLQEGMYLKAMISSSEVNNIMEVPRNLLLNESQLYVVSDTTLALKEVRVLHQNEKTIMVRGLSDGELLLWRPIPRSFNGMRVNAEIN